MCSWLLQAKCFTQAPGPADWSPRTQAAPSFPARSGSSEKYSKLRPHRGPRLRFTPGPSTRSTPSPTASSPMARPMSESSASSQEQAVVTAEGKQVAGTAGSTPSMSPAFFCLRRPWGPSAMVRAGSS